MGIFWLLLNYIWPGGKRNWILPQERPTQEIQLLAWGAEMIRDWHVWQGSVWEKNELWVRNGGAYKNIGIVLTNSYWYLGVCCCWWWWWFCLFICLITNNPGLQRGLFNCSSYLRVLERWSHLSLFFSIKNCELQEYSRHSRHLQYWELSAKRNA